MEHDPLPENEPAVSETADAEAHEQRRVDYLEKLLRGEAFRIGRQPHPKPETNT